MLFTVLLVLSVTITAEGIDIQKYSAIPQPVHGFNPNKYAGQWYLYATTQPCSWKGATKFTDWVQNFVVKSSKTLQCFDTYRAYDSCNTVKTKATMVSPGVLVYKDTIVTVSTPNVNFISNTYNGCVSTVKGDVLSGHGVVVCVDYDRYAITWGCVDKSADGKKCDDGWISVKTRHRQPSNRVLADINAKLKALWGVTLQDVGMMRQTQHGHVTFEVAVINPINEPTRGFKFSILTNTPRRLLPQNYPANNRQQAIRRISNETI